MQRDTALSQGVSVVKWFVLIFLSVVVDHYSLDISRILLGCRLG